MSAKYDIHKIDYEINQYETIGSKEKFWYRDKNNQRFLFKIGRERSGENWSEIVSSKLADLIELPHVDYEPARFESKLGTICKSIVDRNTLIHGNEILHALEPNNYPQTEGIQAFQRIPQYTLLNTLAANQKEKLYPPIDYFTTDTNITSAIDVFVGYLIFDAWIGNTDRHHQNWAWVLDDNVFQISLAPSFDHASSLGRELLDNERLDRIKTNDSRRSIESYARKAFTPFYGDSLQSKPLSTFIVTKILTQMYPLAAKYWIGKILETSESQIENVFDKIPNEFISFPSHQFAVKLLDINKSYLHSLFSQKL